MHCAHGLFWRVQMEEGWVQCDSCEGWVHQICGLFNKGRNDEDMPYQVCPCTTPASSTAQCGRRCIRADSWQPTAQPCSLTATL
jgi:hypothetical protein